ncbi:prepilin-type N-terminal cleavage/methylation domain-containing protein [Arenimonas sp.]|nr:prepilin-type N-terminal cleavage/methylation domain-containing protein [Candidatus Parcubacteria bacterium]
MAQINLKNKGLTLIELILYMSIFSMIFLMIMSSVFYLQKIVQNNNQNYYVKNQVYENLTILQQYLYKSHITITNKNLNFFDKNNKQILTQKLDQKHIQNVYSNKTVTPIQYINFEGYNLQLFDNGRVLKIEISWFDNRRKLQVLTEYLIVINQNL